MAKGDGDCYTDLCLTLGGRGPSSGGPKRYHDTIIKLYCRIPPFCRFTPDHEILQETDDMSRFGDPRIERSLDGAIASAAIAEQQQQITILYGGWLCVCDVTEIQARAILCMARREMEEMMRSSGRSTSLGGLWPEAAASPQLLNPGISMKRSLQRFLQKRKARVCGRGPYQQQKQPSLQSSDSFSSS